MFQMKWFLFFRKQQDDLHNRSQPTLQLQFVEGRIQSVPEHQASAACEPASGRDKHREKADARGSG